MLKTYINLHRSRRSEAIIPKRAQDIIPAKTISRDGILQIGKTTWSKTFAFDDVNFEVAGYDEQAQMREYYKHLLTSIGDGATFQISRYNRHMSQEDIEKNVYIPLRSDDDGLNKYRKEYNSVMMGKLQDSDLLQQDRYITITVDKPDYAAARSYFNRMQSILQNRLLNIGAKVYALNAEERLRLLHDFYRTGQEGQFKFDYDEALKTGYDWHDAIAPFSVEKHPDYLKVGDKYIRTLFALDFATYIGDDYINELAQLAQTMMVSVDVITIPTDEAHNEVEERQQAIDANINKWQRRQNKQQNYSANLPFQLEERRADIRDFLDELANNDEEMHIVTFTVAHTADTLEQLNEDTEKLKSYHDGKLEVATYQQIDALATCLPYGVCNIDVNRTLLSRYLASISLPFRVQEIQEPGGLFFGINSLSRNLILCDTSKLQNQSAIILGIPGSGKSFFTKEQIIQAMIATDDHIYICDPEGEYSELVRAMGGSVIEIVAGGKDHINAMDMEFDYDDNDPVTRKSQYVATLIERMENRQLSAGEASILDRCVVELYKKARSSRIVTLKDLRQLLLQQEEEEGASLALTLERYSTGSLDIFAQPTNVDMSNRLISFDIHKLSSQLRAVGLTVITDFLVNRVNINFRNKQPTHIYIDEMHTMFEDANTAEFFDSAWRQFRKRDARPTAITQNVSVLLNNDKSTAMLSNSEILVLLNQSSPDRVRLTEICGISEAQMLYVDNCPQGCGLIRYGAQIVPFENSWPKNTELYKLMTTKPTEGFSTT